MLPQYRRLMRTAVPDDVLAVPSMMHGPEQRLLYALAKEVYAGAGFIVDAGIFLGASTVCFGQGVLDNPAREAILRERSKPVRSFELGIVNPGMVRFFARHGIADGGEAGESFEPLLRRNIRAVQAVVDLRVGDITTAEWTEGPIEILFLDVIKTKAIQDHVYRTFFPRLIPGKSIVIQQDYFIDGLAFLKVAQERYADGFEFIGGVASTAVFKARETLDTAMFGEPPERGLDADAQFALLHQAEARATEPARRFMVALSRARLVGELKGVEPGQAALAEIAAQHPDFIGETAAPKLRRSFENAGAAIAAQRSAPARGTDGAGGRGGALAGAAGTR